MNHKAGRGMGRMLLPLCALCSSGQAFIQPTFSPSNCLHKISTVFRTGQGKTTTAQCNVPIPHNAWHRARRLRLASAVDTDRPAEVEAEASNWEPEAATADSESANAPNDRKVPVRSTRFILMEGLPFAASRDQVAEFLSSYTIKSINMPVAAEGSGRLKGNKGIAIVELGSEQEAEEATNLNGSELGGRWVKVERCLDPAETRTVKLRGIPFQTTTERLEEICRQFGEINRLTILHERAGIAYVVYRDAEGAQRALELDGSDMEGRWLDVSLYVRHPSLSNRERSGERERAEESPRQFTPRPRYRLRLSGLAFETTKERLQATIESLGYMVKSLFVPPYRAKPERNIGLAYVNLEGEGAENRFLELGSLMLDDREVHISEAIERMDRFTLGSMGGGGGGGRGGGGGGRGRGDGPGWDKKVWKNRVYLGNLPYDLTSDDIRDYFQEKEVDGLQKIVLPNTKVGCAYLAFDTPEHAEQAVGLNGQLIQKNGKARYLRTNLMDESP